MAQVQTVLGPVDGADLGMTLTHEHIFINLLLDDGCVGYLLDHRLMVTELLAFKQAGGVTVVDVSAGELSHGAAPDPGGVVDGEGPVAQYSPGGRDPMNALALKRVAEETGLNIVLGTGHYREPYYDLQWFNEHSTDEIAGFIVKDLEEGIPGTAIRAGIIGEIGADLWYLSAAEERSFRASARAHKRTGVAITTHAARWPVGLPQLDLLESEGVDLRRVIVGHCDSINIPEYHEAIAKRGAFVQFDTIRGGGASVGTEYDLEVRANFVLNMAEKGLLDQLLLSHDNCRRTHLKIAGGSGYDLVVTVFAAKLRERGLSQEQIEMLLVDNPRRALTGQ